MDKTWYNIKRAKALELGDKVTGRETAEREMRTLIDTLGIQPSMILDRHNMVNAVRIKAFYGTKIIEHCQTADPAYLGLMACELGLSFEERGVGQPKAGQTSLWEATGYQLDPLYAQPRGSGREILVHLAATAIMAKMFDILRADYGAQRGDSGTGQIVVIDHDKD